MCEHGSQMDVRLMATRATDLWSAVSNAAPHGWSGTPVLRPLGELPLGRAQRRQCAPDHPWLYGQGTAAGMDYRAAHSCSRADELHALRHYPAGVDALPQPD